MGNPKDKKPSKSHAVARGGDLRKQAEISQQQGERFREKSRGPDEKKSVLSDDVI